MSVSTKELFTAFFKGLAFAKGLNFGEKNRGMAEDRWITIHPWGMSQGEADTGEGKGYYRRIFIDDETGEIEKGLGAGTNIKDLSKTLKDKKNSQENESTSKKTVKEPTTLRDKIKALTEGKEYTEEVANKVGDVMRQELLKNKKFTDLIRKLDLKEEYNKEWTKITSDDISKHHIYTEAQQKLINYTLEMGDKLDLTSDDTYLELFEKMDKSWYDAKEAIKDEILKKIGAEKDKDFILNTTLKNTNEQMIGIFREQFKDVIDFNNSNNIKCSKAQKSNVANGLAMYSKEFVNTLEYRGVEVNTIKKGSRAFYSVSYGEVNVTLQDSYGTVAHEFAHALESYVPKIKNIEKEFYERRTGNESSVSLRDVTGNLNYRSNEITKLDKFLNPYMGKDYSRRDGDDHNYELLSMGMTYLYNKPNELTKDKDYMNFVLGCLAYKG